MTEWHEGQEAPESNRHRPVPDLAVSWTPDCFCTVCDSTQTVTYIDDFLVCEGCESTWELDGTGGVRNH